MNTFVGFIKGTVIYFLVVYIVSDIGIKLTEYILKYLEFRGMSLSNHELMILFVVVFFLVSTYVSLSHISIGKEYSVFIQTSKNIAIIVAIPKLVLLTLKYQKSAPPMAMEYIEQGIKNANVEIIPIIIIFGYVISLVMWIWNIKTEKN